MSVNVFIHGKMCEEKIKLDVAFLAANVSCKSHLLHIFELKRAMKSIENLKKIRTKSTAPCIAIFFVCTILIIYKSSKRKMICLI